MSPWAAVAMAAVAIALSWFVFGELVPLLLFAPVLQRGGISPGWWRGLPPARLVALALLNFVVLTVTGTLVWRTPGWWAVPAAAGGGAVNGALWWGRRRFLGTWPGVHRVGFGSNGSRTLASYGVSAASFYRRSSRLRFGVTRMGHGLGMMCPWRGGGAIGLAGLGGYSSVSLSSCPRCGWPPGRWARRPGTTSTAGWGGPTSSRCR